VDRWIDGAFRNVAVQYHFDKASLSVEQTMHLDHINSALHMAVTLNGNRKVGFMMEEGFFEMEMQKGDVYCTCPAAIAHGIGVPELDEDERSVALQCRSLLSVADADVWYVDANSMVLFNAVTKALEEYGERFRVPTFDEHMVYYNRRIDALPVDQENLEPTIEYTNIYDDD